MSSQPLLPPADPAPTDVLYVVAALWSAVFLGALDGTVVATLMSPIGSAFNKSEQSSYLGTAYLLSVSCFTPLYGRLSDILGRRGAMLLALALFGSGTIACGLATSMESLIVARAVAGMGGGGVMTVTSVSITDLVPLKQRGLYQGMTNILYGLGAGLGGPIGGWIHDTWGWRAAFLLQAPLLLISFTLVALKVNIKLPDAVANERTSSILGRIDFLGSFTLVVFVASLLSAFSIKTTDELPWSHPLISGLLVVSGIFLVAFLYVEARWAPYPVMPLHLITQRTPLAVALANFMASMTAYSLVGTLANKHVSSLYNVPLYFSAVRLSSSTNAGLHLLPHSAAISAGSVLAGWWMRKTGKLYNLTLGSAALCILASALAASWNDKTSTIHLWLDIVPHGFGMASLITTTLIAMIACVYKEDMAVATGITYLFRTTGQVLGVSLSGALIQSILLYQLRKRITGPGSSDVIEKIRHSISSIPDLAPSLQKAATESYATALRVVFISQIAINVLVFIACIPIEEHILPGTRQEQEEYHRRQRSETTDQEQ